MSGVMISVLLMLSLLARKVSSAKIRQILVLLTSYSLYLIFGGGTFLVVLIVSSALNYAFGTMLRRHPSAERLWIGIGFNILLLGVFKYVPAIGPDSWRGIAAPIGISFWTF